MALNENLAHFDKGVGFSCTMNWNTTRTTKIHSRGDVFHRFYAELRLKIENEILSKIDEIHLPPERIFRCSRIIPVLLECILTIF
jgi:hypothetical protein